MKTKALLIAASLFTPFCCLAATPPDCKDCQPSVPETWISLSPLILFLIILFITIIKLRNDKTKLSDLLVDKDIPAAPATGTAAANGATAPSQSVSRFIAFLTGLIALALGVCITSFYMYSYFCNSGNTLDLSKLTNVIWGLGIGVIPYGANKVSSALKPGN